jgi:Flp pilus assembly protein TadG
MRPDAGWPWINPREVWHSLGKLARALARRVEGAVAVEFAIIVPVMGVVLTGTMDLAQLGNQNATLNGAVRAGAAYAITCGNNEAYDCTSGIISAIKSYSDSFVAADVAVSFPNAAEAAGDPAYPQFCTWDDGSTATCGTTCSGSQCPMHVYVTIKVIWTLPSQLMPLAVLPSTLTRSMTVRVS